MQLRRRDALIALLTTTAGVALHPRRAFAGGHGWGSCGGIVAHDIDEELIDLCAEPACSPHLVDTSSSWRRA